MKKILTTLFVILTYSNALECTFTTTDGTIYQTISSTYSEKYNVKSMWFEFKKFQKKKTIATGKDRIEVDYDKFRTSQYVEYDAKGKVKIHFNASTLDEYNYPIPDTAGEWKTNMVKTGAYLLDDFNKEDEKNACAIFSTGWIPTDKNGTIIPPLYTQK